MNNNLSSSPELEGEVDELYSSSSPSSTSSASTLSSQCKLTNKLLRIIIFGLALLAAIILAGASLFLCIGFLLVEMILIVLFAAVFNQQILAVTVTALNWINTLGPVAPLVFCLFYIVATVCFIPGSIITIAVGFFLGLGLGFVTVSAGSTIGATIAFLLGRTIARDAVKAQLSKYPTFEALDYAISVRGPLV